MQTIYQKMETTELDAAIEALKAEVAEVKAKGLALDMARGKPSPSQVDISRPMLDILNADADLHDGNVDCSNYGCFEGIPSALKLAGEFLGCPAEQTLVLLLSRAGKIVSRSAIMQDLWDSDAFVDDNTLTVNINRLRTTLEKIGIKGYLTTHRGQGYSV